MKDDQLRADLASGDAAAKARARSKIELEEVRAIQQFAAGNIPMEEREKALRRWTGHHNHGVAAIAAVELLSGGGWSSAPVIERHMKTWDRASQVQLMQALHDKPARPELLSLARVMVDELVGSTDSCESGEVELTAFVAAKFLVRSSGAQDRARILALLDRCPDDPHLWLAAARADVPDTLVRRADAILTDDARPTELRAAAGLVVAQRKPEKYKHIWKWIQAYLDQFATEDGTAEFLKAGRSPLEPDSRELIRAYKDGQIMLAVLRELPAGELVARIDSLISHQIGTPGACTAAILAKRVPVEYVNALATNPEALTAEVYPALLLAEILRPELANRVESLLPTEALQQLRKQHATYGTHSLGGACVHLTLWD
jgi:hypothetical protein